MSDSDKLCSCGAGMAVTKLQISRRFACPSCGQGHESTDSFDLASGEVPPDLTPLRNLVLKRLSCEETVALETAGTSADTRTQPNVPPQPPEEAEVDVLNPGETGASLLSEIKNGLEGLRGRLVGRRTLADELSTDPVELAAQLEDTAELQAGMILGGYEIVETLGRGGMGVVYKAKDTSLDRFVALKVLSSELVRNKQFLERFDREAKAVARLSHAHITTIYQYSKGDFFFAMEYVEGENLADRITREGPLGAEDVVEIARQTADGLRVAAANKVIHRDIKPSNLLLTPAGQVKITDFGLAKAKASMGHTLDLTSTGVVMGTPLYMSPEQARGQSVDHRSDIYSLGATMFFLLYGCPPFEGDSPIAIILKHINDPVVFPERAGVAAPLRGLLSRMLAKDLDRRPQDYDELQEALQRVQRGEAIEEEPSRRVVVLSRKTVRSKRRTFKVGKLSVARTNLKLGRREKAMSLLQEAVTDGDAALRTESALLLLDLFESDRDQAGVKAMAEVLLEAAEDTTTRAYAAWKLASLDEQAARADLERAIERYETILRDPPPDLPIDVIEGQIRRLRDQLAQTERGGGTTRLTLGSSG